MKIIKKWFNAKKLKFALGILESYGMSVVKIVKMSDGKEYIVASDGSLRTIGKMKK